MNIEMKKNKVSYVKCSHELTTQQSLELDISLPDYCSDIKRILRLFVLPGINSTTVTSDRVSVSGDIILRLVYIGDGDKIDCCEKSVELSAFCDVKDMPENKIVLPYAEVRYVNCRAVSQRRFSVNGSVDIKFKIIELKETEHNCDTDEKNCQLKKEEEKCVVSGVMGEKTFDISETVSLPEEKKSIGKILRCDKKAKLESVKTVNGKVLIKGEFVCDVLYISDTKDSTLEKLHHSMPISQIIEVPAIDDSFLSDIYLDVKNMAVSAKSDASGENKLLEVAAKISAFIKGTKEENAAFITDCYNTSYECELKHEDTEYIKYIGKLSKKKTVNENISVSADVKEVLDARVLSESVIFSAVNGKGEVKAGVVFGFICKDEKGAVQYTERTVDVKFEEDLKKDCIKPFGNPDVFISSLDVRANADKISLKFDCEISGEIFDECHKRTVSEIKADETRPKEKGAAVTVYYCSKGEKVWDIAKRYNRSEKSIREENNLDSETVKEDMMLII